MKPGMKDRDKETSPDGPMTRKEAASLGFKPLEEQKPEKEKDKKPDAE